MSENPKRILVDTNVWLDYFIPSRRGVDLTDHIEEAQHRVFVPGALLVVGHTHQRPSDAVVRRRLSFYVMHARLRLICCMRRHRLKTCSI